MAKIATIKNGGDGLHQAKTKTKADRSRSKQFEAVRGSSRQITP